MNADTLTQGIAALAREDIEAGKYDDPDALDIATDHIIETMMPGASPVEEVFLH